MNSARLVWIGNLVLLSGLVLTAGCSSANKSGNELAYSGLSSESAEAIREIEQEILEADADLKVSDTGSLISDEPSPPSRIPLEINRSVRKWIHYFAVRDRARFQRFLERGSEYKALIQKILQENGVPTELYYLAMIESGYVLHARSRANAVGAWQFIRFTGKKYGLRQNYYLDERRDIIRSTEAAAKYLRNLHTAFQSWYLAMAAYNAGEGRILKAILRGRTRNFWELVEKRALPRETRNYVPKFLAATIIGRHPEKYGFSSGEAPPYPEVELAEVPGGVRLASVAETIGVSESTLRTLNPQLLRGMTPANFSDYEIWVPAGKGEEVKSAAPVLAGLKIRSEARYIAKGTGRYHRVRRGENLALIARTYGLSVSQLKRLNGLRSSRIRAGSRLLISTSGAERTRRGRNSAYHRVRRGEALVLIAERYGMSVKEIKRLNDLKTARIYVGQRLRIRDDI